jgi:lactoylglutathione lyase
MMESRRFFAVPLRLPRFRRAGVITSGRSSGSASADAFHLGFMQESEEQVNAINQRLKDDGFPVPPPRRLHGMWTFYFEAPGGFTIEVGR